ncbi:hypothetical protein FC34_GL001456 [Lacticaseibacillus brantae DSM 23927]|uniref:VanZ-like domain-containing protein n=2 Tax=Lacticaseibacillus brantae TaxID=943673 RepID=A0A0R2B853_9LACO|nr:hypothetical protein FC34_GL001456 [Lacticaseibacillus brantae DSM 23927]
MTLMLKSEILLLLVVPVFIGWVCWRRPHWRALTLAILWLGYSYALIAVTLFPMNWPLAPTQAFVQLALTDVFSWSAFQIMGNLALLIPLAWLLALSQRRFRALGQNVRCCLLVSLSIETLQLVFTWLGLLNRSFDVVDVALNGLGALISFIAYKNTSRWLARRAD